MRKVILMMCMLCSVWSIAQNKPKGNVANETRLNVTNSYLDFDYSGGSSSISVNSNVSWVLKNTASDFFTVIRDDNTITIRCAVNNDYTHRDGFFDVVTNNGAVRKRISVHQSYIYDRHPQPFAQLLQNVQMKITNVRQEHNVSLNGKLGMKIHLSISVFNGPHIRYTAYAWFYVQEGAQMIPLTYYGTSSYTNRQHQVFANANFVSTTTNETLSDIVIFMPYEELHKEGNFSFTIEISALQNDQEWSSVMANWDNERFSYGNAPTSHIDNTTSNSEMEAAPKKISYIPISLPQVKGNYQAEKLQEQYNSLLKQMFEEYNKKYIQFEQNKNKMTKVEYQIRSEELETMAARLEMTKNVAIQDILNRL